MEIIAVYIFSVITHRLLMTVFQVSVFQLELIETKLLDMTIPFFGNVLQNTKTSKVFVPD